MRKAIAFLTVFVMSISLFAQTDVAKYGDKGAPEVRIPQTWHSNNNRTEDFLLVLTDSYGDGWNGNVLTVTGDGGEAWLSFAGPSSDLEAGEGSSVTFTVGGDVPVPGCMDPEANNYDPDATTDDGSCTYDYEVCETSDLVGVVGTNSHPGGQAWYSFDVTESGYLTVTFPEFEIIQVVGVCGITDGYFDDYINGFYTSGSILFGADGTTYYGDPTSNYIGTTVHIRTSGNTDPVDFEIGWATLVEGCMEPQASNYDPDANYDDGSCEYFGDAPGWAGTWRLAPEANALMVGPNPNDGTWWANSAADVDARACLFDDEYVFGEDGSFNNELGSETWLEGWQGVAEGCGAPVAPHDGSADASYAYDDATVTVYGTGAFLGLAKVYNGGECSSPDDAAASITYDITLSDNDETMTLVINFGPGFWTFKLKTSASIDDNTVY